MFTYNEKTPHLQGLVTKRFGVSHLEILNPSKNGVFRSPTYQVKSFWKMLIPETNTSRIALSLDFVVGVSQPHELKTMSPWGEISAILLPWSLTLVNPSESTSTLVFDFDQSVRVAIAACIWRSILRMSDLVDYSSIIHTHRPHPVHSLQLVTNWNNPQKSQPPGGETKKRGVKWPHPQPLGLRPRNPHTCSRTHHERKHNQILQQGLGKCSSLGPRPLSPHFLQVRKDIGFRT